MRRALLGQATKDSAAFRNGAFFYELQPNAAAQAITLYYDDGEGFQNSGSVGRAGRLRWFRGWCARA
jgi:hypothetical protein